MQLATDLTSAIGKSETLFNSSCQPWARPIEYGDFAGLVTDGPFIYESVEGHLIMIWSTFSQDGYAMAQARANSIGGPWEHAVKPLLNSNGGHGMIFRTFQGQLMLAVHSPNSPYRVAERLELIPVVESDGWLVSLL